MAQPNRQWKPGPRITLADVILPDGTVPFASPYWDRCDCDTADPAECGARAFAANGLASSTEARELIQTMPALVCHCSCHEQTEEPSTTPNVGEYNKR